MPFYRETETPESPGGTRPVAATGLLERCRVEKQFISVVDVGNGGMSIGGERSTIGDRRAAADRGSAVAGTWQTDRRSASTLPARLTRDVRTRAAACHRLSRVGVANQTYHQSDA